MTLAPGGNWNSEAGGEVMYQWSRMPGPAQPKTEPRMPGAAAQMFLRPAKPAGAPAGLKPRQSIPSTRVPLPIIGSLFVGWVNVTTLAPAANATVFRYAA